MGGMGSPRKKARTGHGGKAVAGTSREDSPAERTLYDVLQVPKTASKADIKKAYYALAREVHPDKRPDDPEAKEKFQQLQRVKEVLLDDSKRATYDRTGEVPGEDGMGDLSGKSFEELYQYYRDAFPAVTPEDIAAWEAKYPGSKEEREDIIKFYTDFDGDMKHITEFIPFCEEEDKFRIKQVIDGLIADGALPHTAKFSKFKPKRYTAEQVQQLKSRREPEEGWEQPGACGGGGGMAALQMAISARNAEKQGGFDAMIAAMEAKYAKPKAAKQKKK